MWGYSALPQIRRSALCTIGRRPAEQQPGQPPRWSGGDRAFGAWRAGSSRLKKQAVPLAGPRRVVLHGLRDVLVDDHDHSPAIKPALAAFFGFHRDRARESLR